jgi:hypothetical protein
MKILPVRKEHSLIGYDYAIDEVPKVNRNI